MGDSPDRSWEHLIMTDNRYALLERYLIQYDKVILITDLIFGGCRVNADLRCKPLILATEDTAPCYDERYEIKLIDDEVCRSLAEIYHMYDCSDCFIVLEENDRYGGLGNMVRTGVMTKDEAFESVLV